MGGFFKKLKPLIRNKFNWYSARILWFYEPFLATWVSMLIAPFLSITVFILYIPYLIVLYAHMIIFTTNFFDNVLRPKWGFYNSEPVQIKRWVPRARNKVGWSFNAFNFYFIKLPKIRAYLFLSDLIENKRWPKTLVSITCRGLWNIIITPLRITRNILIELQVSRGVEKFWLHFFENLLSLFFENYQAAYHSVFRLYSKSRINRFR